MYSEYSCYSRPLGSISEAFVSIQLFLLPYICYLWEMLRPTIRGAKYKIFGSPPKRKTYGSSKRGWYKWYNHHHFLTQFELDLDFYQTPGGNGINQGGQGELCSPPPSLFSHHWLLRQPITRHWHFSLQKEAGAKAITKFFNCKNIIWDEGSTASTD